MCIVALTSIGDNIGNYGAAYPLNKCKYLVMSNFFTGGAAMCFAIYSYLKCKQHDEVWTAIEAKIEQGNQAWFQDAANADLIKELDADNPEWQDDWVAMTAVDWGHAWLGFLLAGAEILQAGFIMFLDREPSPRYADGQDNFKRIQAISILLQSLIQLVVMLIAWQVEEHLVKPDYMAALITCMIATDKLFDHTTNLLDHVFILKDEKKIHCGKVFNQMFKILHNAGLLVAALYLSDYSQELYFFIENEEIANLEQLTDPKNWFSNQTVIGDYYNSGTNCDEENLDEDGNPTTCYLDGQDPKRNANYCTSDPSPWNTLGYTVKRVHCSKYTYDETLGYGKFEEPQQFPTFFTDDFHPNDGKAWGKMAALWGDVTTNYCPEQCTTPSVHFTTAHECDPTLCNFYKLKVEDGEDTKSAVRMMPLMLMPFDDTKLLGESIQDETEKLLSDLQFQRFDLTFLFKFYIWVNALQAA